MPGEFEPHAGCIMIWPERPGSWPFQARAARKAFAKVITAIAASERVYVAVGQAGMESAEAMLSHIENVELLQVETDDSWARDVAPVFVTAKCTEGISGDTEELRCVNWEFNAWGGTYNGLYTEWERDNAFAGFIAGYLGVSMYDASPFVLEGGAIHCDGQGTILTTEACLLSPGRNPGLSRKEIENKLCAYLGAEKVIWLPRGIYMDETDEHVDNICAFIAPGEVVLAWTDNEKDPQYALSAACLETLRRERDAKGRRITVHKLPIPDFPILVTEEALDGYQFADGEDVRRVGDRLAASYVNFYFSNDSVILPAFGGKNTDSDRRALTIMEKLCPNRRIVQLDAADILAGGGNIHCITRQIPAGKL